MSWLRRKTPRQTAGAVTGQATSSEGDDDEATAFVEAIIRESDPENFVSMKDMRRTIAEARAAADVRGRHYGEWAETIKKQMRDGEYDEVLVLLFECIAATESEYAVTGYGNPGTFYTEKTAIVLRRLKRFDDEVAVLERYVAFLGVERTPQELLTRLDKAQTIRDRAVGE